MESKETPKQSQPATSSTPASVATKTDGSSTSKLAFESKSSGSTMQSFKDTKKGPSTVQILVVLLVMAALGVGTGYGVAAFSSKPGQKSVVPGALNPNAPAKGQTFGTEDTSAYKDTAEGTLKEGGIEGEGQYHLERPGGESQNVYMTSSTVDLSKFVDKKIKVWGATQTAQHAGWLMDVGRVEVQ